MQFHFSGFKMLSSLVRFPLNTNFINCSCLSSMQYVCMKPMRQISYKFNKQYLLKTINSKQMVNIIKRMLSTSLLSRDQDNAKESFNIKRVNSKWLTVPNILTSLRMIVSPYIGYLIFNEQFMWAFGLVFLAGMTDAVDGWIARNYIGQRSIVGSYIDPLADKIMISCLTISLTAVNIIPGPLCGLIVARDLLIASAAAHFHYKQLTSPKTLQKFFDFENSQVQMEPTQISKYNTFLQLGLVTLSVSAPLFNFVGHPLLQVYWYLVAMTTLASGLSYIIKDKANYSVKR